MFRGGLGGPIIEGEEVARAGRTSSKYVYVYVCVCVEPRSLPASIQAQKAPKQTSQAVPRKANLPKQHLRNQPTSCRLSSRRSPNADNVRRCGALTVKVWVLGRGTR
jgi:hypothetical protein